MLKKRLIFILFFQNGYFHLSRNFRLQKVGDSEWLIDKFKFSSIGDFIDELVVIDVSRERSSINNLDNLKETLNSLMKGIFVPLTVGGGIYDMNSAKTLFEAGADKILLNTSVANDKEFVKNCISRFGAQAVVGGVDIRKKEEKYRSFINNGTEDFSDLDNHLELIEDLKFGEVLITDIDRDGTGVGFDMDLLNKIPNLTIPIIVAGGAGKPEHFEEALLLENISASGTGNLFNFIGTGFENTRLHLSKKLNNIRKL